MFEEICVSLVCCVGELGEEWIRVGLVVENDVIDSIENVDDMCLDDVGGRRL